MNNVILIGRATRDAESTETSNGIKIARFNIAVNRSYTSQDGERKTDFFPVVAFRNLAGIIGRFVHKGSRVCVCGSFESRTYENADGEKVAVIELIAQDVEFLDNRKAEQSDGNQTGGGQVRNGKQQFQSLIADIANDMGDYPF